METTDFSTNYITDEQKKRIANIDKILFYYKEKDIPDEIIHKINKKFKSTKNYNFVRTEQIDTGMMLRVVDLSISTISTTGIIVNIKKTIDNRIDNILLYNSSNDIYWRINPDKYYLFHVERGIRKNILIKEYYNNNK